MRLETSETNETKFIKSFLTSRLSVEVNPRFEGHWLLFSVVFLNMSVPTRVLENGIDWLPPNEEGIWRAFKLASQLFFGVLR